MGFVATLRGLSLVPLGTVLLAGERVRDRGSEGTGGIGGLPTRSELGAILGRRYRAMLFVRPRSWRGSSFCTTGAIRGSTFVDLRCDRYLEYLGGVDEAGSFSVDIVMAPSIFISSLLALGDAIWAEWLSQTRP